MEKLLRILIIVYKVVRKISKNLTKYEVQLSSDPDASAGHILYIGASGRDAESPLLTIVAIIISLITSINSIITRINSIITSIISIILC